MNVIAKTGFEKIWGFKENPITGMKCPSRVEIDGQEKLMYDSHKYDFAGFCIYCGNKLIELTEVAPHIGPVEIPR